MRRDVFQAIADPTRRQIIDLLSRESLNLNGIAENFDISRPAISQHIKVLTECGLVFIRQEGRERYCEIKPEKLEEVTDWVNASRKTWNQRFANLNKLVNEMKQEKLITSNTKKNGKRKNHPRRK